MRHGSGRVSGLLLIAIGVAAGMAVSVTPLRAHVTSGFRHLWDTHIRPRADARYLPGATLPPGVTLRGTWKVGGGQGYSRVDMTHAVGDISFGYSFSEAPTLKVVQLSSSPTAECPGTVDTPEAMPGYLCLYEEMSESVHPLEWDPPKPFGVNLYVFSDFSNAQPGQSGFFWRRGTWAATSP